MLRETGRVVALERDGVWVETIPSSLCGRCALKAGCGQGVLARAGERRGLVLARPTPAVLVAHCSVDDTVEIELPESAVVRGSLWLYGLPLLLATGAATVASSASEAVAVSAFIGGLALGFVLVAWHTRRPNRQAAFEPRLSAVVETGSSVIARSDA